MKKKNTPELVLAALTLVSANFIATKALACGGEKGIPITTGNADFDQMKISARSTDLTVTVGKDSLRSYRFYIKATGAEQGLPGKLGGRADTAHAGDWCVSVSDKDEETEVCPATIATIKEKLHYVPALGDEKYPPLVPLKDTNGALIGNVELTRVGAGSANRVGIFASLRVQAGSELKTGRPEVDFNYDFEGAKVGPGTKQRFDGMTVAVVEEHFSAPNDRRVFLEWLKTNKPEIVSRDSRLIHQAHVFYRPEGEAASGYAVIYNADDPNFTARAMAEGPDHVPSFTEKSAQGYSVGGCRTEPVELLK